MDKKRICELVLFIVLVGMIGYILNSLTTQIPSADEVIFLRITDRLPAYECHRQWYTYDGKTDPMTMLGYDKYLNQIYDAKFWVYPALDSVLTYPLVKSLWRDNTPEDVGATFYDFRVLAWLMMVAMIGIVVSLVFKRTKDEVVRLFSMLPLIGSIPFFIQWSGDNWWYYDTFMFLALCVALYLRGTHYEKYIYIPLAIMVGSKLTGMVLLIPFILEKPKTAWCALAIVPHFLMAWFYTQDMAYMFNFWSDVVGRAYDQHAQWGLNLTIRLNNLFDNIKHMWLLLLATIPCFIYVCSMWSKKRLSYFYPLLFGMTLILGFAWVFAYYHAWGVVIIGMMIVALSVADYKENNLVGYSANLS